MRTRLILLLVSAGAATLSAQTRVDLRSQGKSVDFSAADSTKPFKTGTTLPTTCSTGEAFLKSDATAGNNIYLCLSANSWTQVASGSGSLNVGSGAMASRPAACVSGQLYFSTDSGSQGWSYCVTAGNPGTWSANVKGTDGYSPQYRVAAGPPSSGIGNTGDMYLDSTTGDLYGPKSASSWGPIVFNIKGPAGPICGSSGQVLMNSGGACAGATPTGTGVPVLSTGPVLSSPSTGTGPVTETWTCTSAINTAYTLVKLDTANPGAILPARTTDSAPYGVAVGTCSVGNTVQVARSGRVSCVADTNGAGTTTPGNAAVISTTYDGYCMDSGKAATAVGNLTRLVGTILNAAATGTMATVVLTPSQYGSQVAQSTLPTPYSGWSSGAVLSGGGASTSPVVTSVTIDQANTISTPGALNTGTGSGAAGSIVALRGTGTATLGVQGSTTGEWDIAAPANFTSWTFTAPVAPCGAHQWWTTDTNGNGGCMQPASSDLSDVSSIALLGTGQAFTGDKSFSGKVDASGATHTIPAKVGAAASKPASCTVGEMYFATDATAGRNWYYCTATNTWSQQAAGGSANVASTTNLVAGDGVGNGIDSGIAASNVALKSGTNTYTGTQDNSGAAHTIPAKVGAASSKPASCTVGEMYFATDATAGRNWYYCTATNTWSQQAAGGSGATVASTTNLVAGDGAGNGVDSGIAASNVALKSGTNTYTGTQDNSGAAHTIPAKVGAAASKPATCTPGEEYFATDATAGQNKYYCTASNTWTQQLNSGGGGSGSNVTDCTDPTVTCIMEPFAPGSNGNLLIGMFGWNAVGGPTIAGYASPGSGLRGGYQITSGAAANNTTDVELAGGSAIAQFPRLSDTTNWTALFKFTTPSNLAEYILEIGFDTTAASTNILTQGVYLRYGSSTGCDNTNHPNLTDTTWMFVSRDSSAINAVAGPAIAASTTYWLRLRNTGSTGHVLANIKAVGGSWLANDVDLNTNIPTSAVVPMFKQTVCNTTARTLQMNWFSWVKTGQN